MATYPNVGGHSTLVVFGGAIAYFAAMHTVEDAPFVTYLCAYCGEENETLVDPSGGLRQSYTEDCSVCCQPNLLKIKIETDTGDVFIEVAQES